MMKSKPLIQEQLTERLMAIEIVTQNRHVAARKV